MQDERAAPAWIRGIAFWHAVALLILSFACYVFPDVLFGDVIYLSQAVFPIALLGTALFAIGVLLTMASFSRSKKVLRISLITVFILDMQLTIVLLMFTFQIDNAELLGGVSVFTGTLATLVAFAIPAAAAVFMLGDARRRPDQRPG